MTLELTGLFGYDIRDKNVREEINNINNKIKGHDSQFQTIANEKVDKVDGKGLSTNDYTTSEKQKLEGLSNYVHPSTHDASIINQDSTHRFVTDEEKSKWNSATGVTDEQIDNAVTSYLNANPISGGLTTTAKNLLITILRNAMYTSNQSANITALESALASSSEGGGDTPIVTNYNITNNLTNCANSNVNTTVAENSSYVANITASDGYTLDSVIVTMGGEDITSTVYSEGIININSVTGNIVIIASASENINEPQLVTDGLENYFDFRTATYNNSGSGGSTIVNASQGNGSLYCWANNMVTEQNVNYGMLINRAMIYAGNGGTSATNCGTSFTWIFKSYMNSSGSPLMSNDYAALNNGNALLYKPKYNKASGTAQVTQEAIGAKKSGYNTYSIVVDENICKLYCDATLLKSIDGSTIDGFTSWYDKLTAVVLFGNTTGYWSQVAVYNKALSEVQIVDMIDYLKSLEVA